MSATRSALVIRNLAVGLAATLAVTLALLAVSAARAGTTHIVQIVDFAFAPPVLTVSVGDTVTWTNQDIVGHTATSTTGAFDSGLLAQGESYSLTFTAAGSYPYLCTPHPDMTGTIVVVAAAATPTPAAPAPTSAPAGGLPNVAVEPHGSAPSNLLIIGAALLVASLVAGARRARRGPG